MTFNLIQSINLHRPFLGIESLTTTMENLAKNSFERQISIGIFAEIRKIMVWCQSPKAALANPTMYRPAGQPNLEYTMWKFQNFSATQILREAPETAI